jgi:hypothetical protein
LPPEIRIAFALDNLSPHLTTKKDSRERLREVVAKANIA